MIRLKYLLKVDIFEDEVYFDSQSKTAMFYTGDALEFIPNSNIKYSYPIDGMLNFYKQEYDQEIGYIELKSGQPKLLYPKGSEKLICQFL